MDKLVIDDVELTGRRVLMRVDFNVPILDGKIGDTTRIEAALPSINKVISEKGKLILMSHLGRPKGKVVEKYSLAPVAKKLSDYLGKAVTMASDCVGSEVEAAVNALNEGDVLLLENTRFHKAETENDATFSKQLASVADIFISDAFGAAHRAHASTVGVTKHLKENAAGYLLQTEIESLTKVLENPEKPYVVILGGAKVSDKIKVIQNLLTKASAIIIGGGMSYTFLKAKGYEIGGSLLEEAHLSLANNVMVVAKNPHPHKKIDFMLPSDHTIAREKSHGEFKVSEGVAVENGWQGVDIGPQSITHFTEKILNAKSILWNGPMGIFENDNFARGTMAVAQAVATATKNGAFSVVGGGDSVAALEKAGLKSAISHVSTGGGASLEFMAGMDLPGISALTKVKKATKIDSE